MDQDLGVVESGQIVTHCILLHVDGYQGGANLCMPTLVGVHKGALIIRSENDYLFQLQCGQL